MLRRRFGDRIVLATGVALFVLGLVLAGLSPSGASIWPAMVPTILGGTAIATVVGTRLGRQKEKQGSRTPTVKPPGYGDEGQV